MSSATLSTDGTSLPPPAAVWHSYPAGLANHLTEGRWEYARHLDVLGERLADAAFGNCPRLVVTMPPQNGKSSLVGHWFPVWYLNQFPDRRLIFVSYAAEYAEEWGRRVRNSIDEHAADLVARLAADSAAAAMWETTAGGGMVSVGVGGAVTGRRANGLIFDDPFKNAEEANSPTFRNKVWEFFKSAAYTRLTPDGFIVVVMTRWHEDDLVGRLKEEERQGGEHWEHVSLPAVAEEGDPMGRTPGEPLWPSRWPLSALERIRRALGSYRWSALYQQRPTAAEGNYFKREWFARATVAAAPPLEHVVRCWDLAATAAEEGGDPDWLAGVLMGKSDGGVYYVLDVARERLTPEGVESLIRRTARQDGRSVAIRIEQEGAASGKLIAHHFTRMLDGYDARFTGIPRGSKAVRVAPFNAACERGDVRLVRGAWNDAFIEELVSFPNGTHDDQVDGAGGAYQALSKLGPEWTPDDLREVFDRRDAPKSTGRLLAEALGRGRMEGE